MKMNVYADKYAQNTRKGDMEKKTEPLVCVITGVWYLYGGFVLSHWDDQKDRWSFIKCIHTYFRRLTSQLGNKCSDCFPIN